MRTIDPTIMLAAMAQLQPLPPRGPARLLARARTLKFAPVTPAAITAAPAARPSRAAA